MPRRDGLESGRALALERGRDLQAMAVNRALRSVGAGALSLLRAAFVRLLRRLRGRRAHSWSLLSLNDRMLADIGLRRGDVQGLAYGVIPAEQMAPVARPRASKPAAEVVSLRQRTQLTRDPPPSLPTAA